MRNIEFKGTLTGDIEQISSGKELPEGSTIFKEPETSDKAFLQGAIFAGPLILVMMLVGYARIFLIYGRPHGLKFGHFVIAFFASLVCIYISQYIHEYIHAITLPKDILKQIYVMPQNHMLFVYIEDPVPKKAFLISVLSPAILLGIIPFIAWLFAATMFSIPVSFGILMYCICMTGCALGDYLNEFNCIRQVPKGGKVFNRGWHTYWIKQQRLRNPGVRPHGGIGLV